MAPGAYPDVSLTEAHAARDAARKQLSRDIDPMAERKAAKYARQLSAENSFAAVARLWWDNWQQSCSSSHVVYVMRRLEADIFPAIGARPIDQIEAPELVKMAKDIQANRRPGCRTRGSPQAALPAPGTENWSVPNR